MFLALMGIYSLVSETMKVNGIKYGDVAKAAAAGAKAGLIIGSAKVGNPNVAKAMIGLAEKVS